MADHGESGKVWTVLKWTFIVFVIALIIMWFWAGGIAAAGRTAHMLTNPIDIIFYNGTSTGYLLRLPWQPDEMVRGPDISGYAEDAQAYNDSVSSDEQIDEQSASTRSAQTRAFGDPSLYIGRVTIIDHTATESDARHEYIEIQSAGQNTQPIVIAGWSLQSAVSGLRISIPMGVSLFQQGVVNTLEPIYLRPGESAIITTGASPVGVSFRENICSGYLAGQQSFDPPISSECPYPSQALPETAENLKTYASACLDYVNNLTRCQVPTNIPNTLSSACRSFVGSAYSYNGCTYLYRNQQNFSDGWRVYLGLPAGLWYDTHDIVRLLDNQGRTVDVLTY